MKRSLKISLAAFLTASVLAADPTTREKLLRHFGGWYAFYPNSRVTVSETDEVRIPGLEAYRVQRQTDSKRHQEAGIAFYDAATEEVFVGRVLHDAARASAPRAFDPLVDGPEIDTHLSDALGAPAALTLRGSRESLQVISVALRLLSNVWLDVSGFISQNGASVLVGEFQPLREGPDGFRRRLLAERPGVRLGSGKPLVVEFIDFQCDRCRKRAPEVKEFVAKRGGSVEVRFYPLVKVHPWAFAAAESAAALAAISSKLYESYESALFARAETMNEDAARHLAADVAEAAGKSKEFASEIASGRARGRVLADLKLGMRLGVTGTPYFVHEGTLVGGEPELLERVVGEGSPAPSTAKAR